MQMAGRIHDLPFLFCPLSCPSVRCWEPQDSSTRVIYQWLRWEQLSQWWHWILLLTVVALIVGHVVSWYRRDWGDLARPAGWSLVLLRLAAFVGILLYFLQLEKRTEQRVVRHSKVAVLVDTSLSMSAPGTPSPSGVPADWNRAEEAARLLDRTPLLDQLSDAHEITVYRFDQSSRPTPLQTIEKRSSQSGSSEQSMPGEADSGSLVALQTARRIVLAAMLVLGLSLVMITISLSAQLFGAKLWQPGAWLLLAGSGAMLVALVLAALGIVPNTRYSMASLMGRSNERVPGESQVIEASSRSSAADMRPSPFFSHQ